MARINTKGPLDPFSFVENNGALNLVKMCLHTTLAGWRVLFTGQWDGSLCHGCAMGVLATIAAQSLPQEPAPMVAQPFASKVMAGYIGVYADYYDHARERRVQQLLSERLYRISRRDAVDDMLPVQDMQPHVNLNTAVMWLFALPVSLPSSSQ